MEGHESGYRVGAMEEQVFIIHQDSLACGWSTRSYAHPGLGVPFSIPSPCYCSSTAMSSFQGTFGPSALFGEEGHWVSCQRREVNLLDLLKTRHLGCVKDNMETRKRRREDV